MKNKFSSQKMYERLKQIFDSYIPTFPQEMQLILPNPMKDTIQQGE